MREQPLSIETEAERDFCNSVLHCGAVQVGDEWDTAEAWPDPKRRRLARRVLQRFRASKAGRVRVTEDQRRLLATCCGD